MNLANVGCLFTGFILFISGVQGDDFICALTGSSVDLPCSSGAITPNTKWYTLFSNQEEFNLREVTPDGDRITFTKSDNSLTLKIKDLKESDSNVYCCGASTEACFSMDITVTLTLTVTDLQVKVLPVTEGLTASLMCSTSCPLTKTPAGYIWYKNGELLHQDWSPWYQELVSAEEATRYSCAIKGREDLRAAEVSVDSITPTCFTVTYSKGSVCANEQMSVDAPCTIVYPREVHVERSPTLTPVTMTCNTSCLLIGSKTAYTWFQGGKLSFGVTTQDLQVMGSTADGFSCAVRGLEELLSAEVCADECWKMNYASRRICALEGSTVDISCEYSFPKDQAPENKVWHKIQRTMNSMELREAAGRVEYHDTGNQHTLRLKNLVRNNSAEYFLVLQRNDRGQGRSDFPRVDLIVTGLEVMFSPSAVVTVGQRVTLTCRTSCPLTDTNYIWFFNSRPLNGPENQNKYLVLHQVSTENAGSYSCAVRTQNNFRSGEKMLTVDEMTGETLEAEKTSAYAVIIVCVVVTVVVLLIMPLAVFLFIRKMRSS